MLVSGKLLALSFFFFVFLVLRSQRLGRLSGQFQHCGFFGGSRAFAGKRGQHGYGFLKTHPGHVRPNHQTPNMSEFLPKPCGAAIDNVIYWSR